jgi:hypothetical protein
MRGEPLRVLLAYCLFGAIACDQRGCALTTRDFTAGSGLAAARLPDRAITGYLSGVPWAMKEFIFFTYASWKYLTEGYPGRLDLVIAGIPDAAGWMGQLCNVVQPSDDPNSLRREPSDCYFHPFADKAAEHYGYHGINQFAFILDKRISKWLRHYNYIIKTDLDVFFLPGFVDYVPRTTSGVSFGVQYYVLIPETASRIKNVSRSFGYIHQNVHNVGMCFTGTLKQQKQVARKTIDVLKYILLNTFPQLASGGPSVSYKDGWPNWNVYLSVMYAQEVVVNHLFANLTLDKRFDAHTDLDTPTADLLHLHTQHGASRFDKRSFLIDFYADVQLHKLNVSISRDCATYIAVSSYRVSNPRWQRDAAVGSVQKEDAHEAEYQYPDYSNRLKRHSMLHKDTDRDR